MKIKTYQKTANIKAVLISKENGFEFKKESSFYEYSPEKRLNTIKTTGLNKKLKGTCEDTFDENGNFMKFFNSHYLVGNEDNEKDKGLVDKETFEKTYKEKNNEN